MGFLIDSNLLISIFCHFECQFRCFSRFWEFCHTSIIGNLKLFDPFIDLNFPDVPSKPQSTAPPSRNSSKTPTSPVPSALKMKEYVRHKVDYLGALPISASRSTNLAALQRPLKDLYFKWRALRNLGHSNLPGTLEINDNGLTVQYIRELHKGVQVSKHH